MYIIYIGFVFLWCLPVYIKNPLLIKVRGKTNKKQKKIFKRAYPQETLPLPQALLF